MKFYNSLIWKWVISFWDEERIKYAPTLDPSQWTQVTKSRDSALMDAQTFESKSTKLKILYFLISSLCMWNIIWHVIAMQCQISFKHPMYEITVFYTIVPYKTNPIPILLYNLFWKQRHDLLVISSICRLEVMDVTHVEFIF